MNGPLYINAEGYEEILERDCSLCEKGKVKIKHTFENGENCTQLEQKCNICGSSCFTCSRCNASDKCAFAYDRYNVNGACLADK